MDDLIRTSSNPYTQAHAGLHYDHSDLEGETKSVEGTAIPYGRAVTYGTNEGQCKLFEAGAKVIGVSVARMDKEQRFGTFPAQVEDEAVVTETETLEIATQGRIWVRLAPGQTPAEGSPVHTTPDAGVTQGTFGGSTLSNAELIPNMSFGIRSNDDRFAVVNLNR